MTYLEKLQRAVSQSESLLCVGLDPNPELIPAPLKEAIQDPKELVIRFCSEVIDATSDFCCAYKPNYAFFEALGPGGLAALQKVMDRIPDGKIVIADAKRGDIGSTAWQYKKAVFDHMGADAVTLNPLMGFDTFDPFCTDPSKAVYSLVLTSNPGAKDLLTRKFEGKPSMAAYIADRLRLKGVTSEAHIGMVVGATWPSLLKPVLEACPEASLLIPGVGSQGGKAEDLFSVLANHRGIPLISSSRSILYAGEDRRDWKDGVARSAKELKEDLGPMGRRFY